LGPFPFNTRRSIISVCANAADDIRKLVVSRNAIVSSTRRLNISTISRRYQRNSRGRDVACSTIQYSVATYHHHRCVCFRNKIIICVRSNNVRRVFRANQVGFTDQTHTSCKTNNNKAMVASRFQTKRFRNISFFFSRTSSRFSHIIYNYH